VSLEGWNLEHASYVFVSSWKPLSLVSGEGSVSETGSLSSLWHPFPTWLRSPPSYHSPFFFFFFLTPAPFGLPVDPRGGHRQNRSRRLQSSFFESRVVHPSPLGISRRLPPRFDSFDTSPFREGSLRVAYVARPAQIAVPEAVDFNTKLFSFRAFESPSSLNFHNVVSVMFLKLTNNKSSPSPLP